MKVVIEVDELSPIYSLSDIEKPDPRLTTIDVPEVLYREYLANRMEFWIIQKRLAHLNNNTEF